MSNCQTLQDDVLEALRWELSFDGASIGVTVDDGIITLTGTVDSHAIKIKAESAAKNVAGVKAVVEKIEIKSFSSLVKRDDNEIAFEVVNVLKWSKEIPPEAIKVKVENRWVTLEGSLPWHFQKEAVQKAVVDLFGIRGITNSIIIKAETHDAIEKKGLQGAFRRNTSLDERKIEVDVSGTIITLSGTVESAYQKSEAGRIAWNTPGVSHVENTILVEYGHAFVD